MPQQLQAMKSLLNNRNNNISYPQIIVLAALVTVCLAAPPQFTSQPKYQETGAQAYLVKEEPSNNIGLGNYNFAYEQSDGQTRQETAEVERVRAARSGEEDSAILRVRGSFGWVDPATGQNYQVTYVADENGYQAQGAHLPVAK